MAKPAFRPLAALALALALGGCAAEDSPEAKAAKAAVAEKFAYPSRVQFRDIRPSSLDPHDICGEANGRLIDGELSGFRRFVWSRRFGPTIEGMTPVSGDADFNFGMAHMDDAIIDAGCHADT